MERLTGQVEDRPAVPGQVLEPIAQQVARPLGGDREVNPSDPGERRELLGQRLAARELRGPPDQGQLRHPRGRVGADREPVEPAAVAPGRGRLDLGGQQRLLRHRQRRERERVLHRAAGRLDQRG